MTQFLNTLKGLVAAYYNPSSSAPISTAKPPETTWGLIKPALFYDEIRRTKLFGPILSSAEFQGCENILNACKKAKWPISYTAYALATAYHETAHTMQPIKEYGGRAYHMKLYDITGNNPTRARAHGNTQVGDGAKYCGRGYVQLTWKNNYAKVSKEIGVDLVNNPDLALDPKIASDIMIYGMQQGWFTGKKLITYLPNTGQANLADFIKARYIINGQDDATLIANYALKFQTALKLGVWT